MFSAGADIKERVDLVHEPGDYTAHNRTVREFFYAARDCTRPVIAAVNGPALGAGFALALVLRHRAGIRKRQLRHAGDQCRARRRRGIPDGAFRPLENTRDVFHRPARSRRRALSPGAIEAVRAARELMDAALDFAREIAAKSPLAVRQIKRTLNTIEEMPVRDAYRYEQTVTVELSHTEDARKRSAHSSKSANRCSRGSNVSVLAGIPRPEAFAPRRVAARCRR